MLLKKAINKQLCLGGFSSNTHKAAGCRKARVCGISGCVRKHHRMFHDTNLSENMPPCEGVNILLLLLWHNNRCWSRPACTHLVKWAWLSVTYCYHSRIVSPTHGGTVYSRPELMTGMFLRRTSWRLYHQTSPREGVNQEDLNNHHVVEPVSCTLYQVVSVTLINNDKSVATHAILETGSSLILLDSDVADSLSLQREKRSLQLIWTQEQQFNHEDSQSLQVWIKGRPRKGTPCRASEQLRIWCY